MPTLHAQYRLLYERLKGPGLNELLASRASLTPPLKETLKTLARLPHPDEATPADIAIVCEACLSGPLRAVSREAELRPIAQNLLRLSQGRAITAADAPASGPPREGGATLDDVAMQVSRTNELIMAMSQQVSGMARQTNYTLKSLCPGCDGDLEIYVHASPHGQPELRLRCKDCFDGSAPARQSWHLADLK